MTISTSLNSNRRERENTRACYDIKLHSKVHVFCVVFVCFQFFLSLVSFRFRDVCIVIRSTRSPYYIIIDKCKQHTAGRFGVVRLSNRNNSEKKKSGRNAWKNYFELKTDPNRIETHVRFHSELHFLRVPLSLSLSRRYFCC